MGAEVETCILQCFPSVNKDLLLMLELPLNIAVLSSI